MWIKSQRLLAARVQRSGPFSNIFTVCQQTRPLLCTVANNLIRLAERAVGEPFFRGLLKPAIPYYLQIFRAISYWLTLSPN